MLRRAMMAQAASGGGATTSWNPSDMSTGLILSNSNRTMTAPADTTARAARTVSSKSSGKWVLPIKVVSRTSAYVGVGIASSAAGLPSFWSTSSGALYDGDGGKFRSGYQGAYSGVMYDDDIVEILYDADAGTLGFTKNGASLGTAFTGIPTGWHAAAYVAYDGASLEIVSSVSTYASSNGFSLWD